MTCPSCGHDNPPENKFCGECGTALAFICPNCSAANPPENKFCGECGAQLAGAAIPTHREAPSRAERRIVSVLFADLVGFTPFSESRDPEEVRDLLTRYFDRSREVVERFAGTVDKFIGDAVMAWWGAVEAHEDDSERAVRAALELVDVVSKLGSEIGAPDLALRAGITTGETSVSPGGNEKGLVVGDLVNIASRLQSIAEPGTVVVGESTRNLVADAVEFQALGNRQVKGKEARVAAFRAVRVVAERGGRGRSEGIDPPYVGRKEELRLLKDQLHATGREGRARLVSIMGEAGIGKSRLTWELQKYLDGIAEVVYWHTGRSPAYGDGIAFWSLGEMIRWRAGIAETDDRAKSRMKLRTAVAEHMASDEERRWVEPRLAALLGLEDMPPGDRHELFAAIRTFFQRIADLRTTALVFEDLHWADDGVLEFITDLVERSARHPILVITLSRPDLLDRHPGWGAGRRNHISMHLAPLPDDEMHDLVTGMAPGVPDNAIDAVVNRAEGIPLYAVEFVRMLLAGGELERVEDGFALSGDLSDLAVPDSLAAVIGARLDRLDAADRELVQDAAVLGQSFTLNGLAAVRDAEPARLESALRDLVHQELFELDEDPRSPERGQYRFVQSLIREVAYSRLSRDDRHLRHLRVAEFFASLGDAELAGVVASHYLSAHETAPEGGEDLLEQGRRALVDAAKRMMELQSPDQALSLYMEALKMAHDEERGQLLVAATEAAGWAGRVGEAAELGRRAVETMEEAGDDEGRLRAVTMLAFVLNSFFRSDEAVALLRPLYDELEAFDTAATAGLGLEMIRAHMLAQDPEPAVEVAERVLPHAEKAAPAQVVVDGIISKATSLARLGRGFEAMATLHGAVELSDQLGLQSTAIRALNNLAVVQAYESPQASLATAEEMFSRVMELGAPAWVTRVQGDHASALMLQGRYEDALEMLNAVPDEEKTEITRRFHRVGRMVVTMMTTTGSDDPRALIDEVESWGDFSDSQAREAIEDVLSIAEAAAGDMEASSDRAVSLEAPWALSRALQTALWARDRDRVRRALDAIDRAIPRGRLAEALRRLGEAGIALLDGDREASARYQSGLDLGAEIMLPFELTGYRATFGRLVGLDDPAAFDAAAEARRWLRQTGSIRYEQVWAEALPGDDAVIESA